MGWVQALKRHTAEGMLRERDARFPVSSETERHLVRHGYAKRIPAPPDWRELLGRELRTEPLTDPAWPRVVACLNIWNDAPALRQTLPTWAPHVDHVIVVDGPYVSTGAREPVSTDGLNAVLADLPSVELVTRSTPWPDQLSKRSAYLERARPGDLLFIIDADEFVTGGELLRQTPYGDVAWVTVSSPLYTRRYGQPRLIRAQPGLRYGGRHHWLYVGDRLLTTHQYGGPGFEHRVSPVSLFNHRGLGHNAQRAAAKRQHLQVQFARESRASTGAKSDRSIGSRETLRIVQVGVYDAGLVGFRLHTAINATTPHVSVFAAPRPGAPKNPFEGPVQFDAERENEMLRWALEEADIVHCHLNYSIPARHNVSLKRRRVVIHHHGTMFRRSPATATAWDVAHNAGLRLVSNLELLRYGNDLHWLPNPVPVARYQRLRCSTERIGNGPFRIAHSPSKRERKGTQALLNAVARLRAEGLDVAAVLIEGMSHGAGLKLKATCDVCFDSFQLGIQCSGLEAAAMDMPVIAGDEFVRDQYLHHIGAVPYTYANDEDSLTVAIERLMTDPVFRANEEQRVHDYVLEYHDEAAVAHRYLDLLDEAFGWRAAMQHTGRRKPQWLEPPKPETPQKKKPKRQRPVPVEIPRPPEPEKRSA